MITSQQDVAHSSRLGNFIQPKDPKTRNEFLEANNTPFNMSKHGSVILEHQEIKEKPTTTKFEEYVRYKKLHKWDNIHLAAKQDWSMEVIAERNRQCEQINLTRRSFNTESIFGQKKCDKFISSPHVDSKRQRIEFYKDQLKDRELKKAGVTLSISDQPATTAIGGFQTEGFVCKAVRGTGHDVTELMGWNQEEFNEVLGCAARVNRVDKNDQAALHIASEKDNYRFVKNLLGSPHIELDITDKKGWTPMHYAVASGNTRTVTALCLKKADVNVKAPADGATPLLFAAAQGFSHILRILYLFGGADVNATTKQGRNALHLAARTSDSVKILNQILDIAKEMNGIKAISGLKGSPNKKKNNQKKLTIDSVDNFGNTVLHYAARAGNLEMCKLLVESFNCSIKIRNNKGYTPLHIAIYKGFFGVAEFLLNSSQNYAALAEVLVSLLASENKENYREVTQYIKDQLDRRMQFNKN